MIGSNLVDKKLNKVCVLYFVICFSAKHAYIHSNLFVKEYWHPKTSWPFTSFYDKFSHMIKFTHLNASLITTTTKSVLIINAHNLEKFSHTHMHTYDSKLDNSHVKKTHIYVSILSVLLCLSNLMQLCWIPHMYVCIWNKTRKTWR